MHTYIIFMVCGSVWLSESQLFGKKVIKQINNWYTPFAVFTYILPLFLIIAISKRFAYVDKFIPIMLVYFLHYHFSSPEGLLPQALAALTPYVCDL